MSLIHPSIFAIAAIVTGSVLVGSAVYAANDEISINWDPADTSSDPNHLVVVNGAFTRIGLVSDSTNDVQGDLSGKILDKKDNESTKTVTSTVGSKTVETMVSAHTTKGPKLDGTISIDGVTHNVKFKPSDDVTFVNVEETITTSSGIQSATQDKRTISGSISLCDAQNNCMDGFAIIRTESSHTIVGGSAVTFITDTLEAEVIGEDGLFELRMNKLQRIIS